MYTFIYSLVDPRDNSIKYIGKTNKPKKRLYEHVYDSLNKVGKKTKKEVWICKLENLNLKPILEFIKEVNISEYEYWEEYYIKYYKSIGCCLLNYDDKGKGFSHKKTKKAMKKISKKVYQYDLNGNFISEYKSVREAARKLKINHGNIVKVCHKKFSHSSGFIFSYNKEETVEKVKNPSGIKKKIFELDNFGNKIKEYASIADASRSLNIDAGNISRVCCGKIKSVKGKVFKFC